MSLRRTVTNSLSTWLNRYSPERLFLSLLRLENAHPPVFIVGTPRSGTTIVYQHLVNRFHFSYFSNLSRRFSIFVVPSAALGRAFFSFQPDQHSRFGVTAGALGPSDGWGIFHRWFPRNGTRAEGSVRGLHELKSIVRIHEKLFDAPFVNKNNANSLRISELAGLFPDALFVHVHRSPEQTVFSLMHARKQHGAGINDWWGTSAPDLLGCQFDSEEAQVVRQVVHLERLICESLEVVPETRKISVSYEEFCRDPAGLCENVGDFFRTSGYELKPRTCDLPGHYEVSSKASLYDSAVVQRIEHELGLASAAGGVSSGDQANGS